MVAFSKISRKHGLTLVEILVGIAIALLVTIIGWNFFVNSRRTAHIGSLRARAQRDARAVMENLRNDLQNTIAGTLVRTVGGTGNLSLSMERQLPDGTTDIVIWAWVAPDLRRTFRGETATISRDVVGFDLIPETVDQESEDWGKHQAEILIQIPTGFEEPRNIVEIDMSAVMVIESEIEARRNSQW